MANIMNICVALLLPVLLGATANEYNDRNPIGAVSYQTYTRIFNRPSPKTVTQSKDAPVPFPVHIDRRIPYPIKIPVAVPFERPLTVQEPKSYPIPLLSALPFQVEKPISYPLNVLQPLAINQPLAVLMNLPYLSTSSTLQNLKQQPAQQQIFNQQHYS